MLLTVILFVNSYSFFFCHAGWAAKGPSRAAVRFDTPHEHTWLNSQSAQLNLARAAARSGQFQKALDTFRFVL